MRNKLSSTPTPTETWENEFDSLLERHCLSDDRGVTCSFDEVVLFVKSLLSLQRTTILGEIDGIDLMLAIIQSTSRDTTREEMIRMIDKVRDALSALRKEGK